jgi:hypothetical protein
MGNKLSKTANHIIIDAKNQTITLVTDKELTLSYMQSVVGGLIERTPYSFHRKGIWCKDDLFVNEEGRINGTNFGFTICGHTFFGNGIIVGEYVERGSEYGYLNVLTDIEQLKEYLGGFA